MKCSVTDCERTALRIVGRKGFCGKPEHIAQAYAREAERLGVDSVRLGVDSVRARTSLKTQVDQRMKDLEREA